MNSDYDALCKAGTTAISVVFIFFICIGRAVFGEALALEFKEVEPGVYVHFGLQQTMSTDNRGDIANIGFVIGDKSIAVIDPGGSPEIGALMRQKISSISPLPISHVIITHAHPDHMFGGSAFADVPNIIAHRHFTRSLAQRAEFYRTAFKALFSHPDQVTALTPTEDAFDNLQIDLGGRTLTVHQHPTGHTDNDITVFDNLSRTLWASDLLFVDRVPSLDGSLTGWISIMNTLGQLPVELVIPGHGPHGSWDELAQPQHRYLQKLLDQTRESIAQNGRLADAIETVASDEAIHWLLFESRHPGNVTKAFTELEWE